MLEYSSFSCKWHELDKELSTRLKDKWTLHSFAMLNQGFNEYTYVIMQRGRGI